MEDNGRRDQTPVKDKDSFVNFSLQYISSYPQLKSSFADQPIQLDTQQK